MTWRLPIGILTRCDPDGSSSNPDVMVSFFNTLDSLDPLGVRTELLIRTEEPGTTMVGPDGANAGGGSFNPVALVVICSRIFPLGILGGGSGSESICSIMEGEALKVVILWCDEAVSLSEFPIRSRLLDDRLM